MELLPQSKATSASVTDVNYDEFGHVEITRHQLANGITRSPSRNWRDVRGDIHAEARASDTSIRLDQLFVHRRASASFGVVPDAFVRARQDRRVSRSGARHPSLSRRLTAACNAGSTNQNNVGMGRAVTQVRFVLDDDRTSIRPSNDDGKTSRGCSS